MKKTNTSTKTQTSNAQTQVANTKLNLACTTIVVLAKTAEPQENGATKLGIKTWYFIEGPVVGVDIYASGGKWAIGHFTRRLKTVKEVAAETGLSKNKASAMRNNQPLLCLADFPGQAPLMSDERTIAYLSVA